MVPGSRHLLLFLTTTLGHAPTETQVTATMPPVHSKLAASSASAAQTVEKFENAAQSYRVVLSDEGIEDMVVECSGTPAKNEKGVVIEGQFDVKVEVYSAKEYAKSSKKIPIRYFAPECPVRFSNMHTVGAIFSKESENVKSRKRMVSVQTKFEEDEDVKINEQVGRLADHLQPYKDINVEIHWYRQQLAKVDRKICKAILTYEKFSKEIKAALNGPARLQIAVKHKLEQDDVTSEHPEYAEALVDQFETRSEKAMPIKLCTRQSIPDKCPLGADCRGAKCTNAQHVAGIPQYVIVMRDYIFGAKEYNPEVKIPALPFTNVVERWHAEHPGLAAEAHKLDVHKASVDALTYQMVIADPLVQYQPVFYRQCTAKANTLDITKKQIRELIQQGKPLPPLYFTEPHRPIVRFGSTARFCVTIRAGATTGKGGVGMRLAVDPTQIVMVRQQNLSYAGVTADEIASYQADMDLDSNYTEPVVGAGYSSTSPSLMSVIASASVHAPVPGVLAPMPAAGEKRKAEDEGDAPPSKAARVDQESP